MHQQGGGKGNEWAVHHNTMLWQEPMQCLTAANPARMRFRSAAHSEVVKQPSQGCDQQARPVVVQDQQIMVPAGGPQLQAAGKGFVRWAAGNGSRRTCEGLGMGGLCPTVLINNKGLGRRWTNQCASLARQALTPL